MLDISAPHLAQISCRNSAGMISYVVDNYGKKALFTLFNGILAGNDLVSTHYQYLGSPLTLNYFKNANNWYSNEINLIIFENLSKIGIDAFDTGQHAIFSAKKSQNITTIAYMQMLGPIRVIKKISALNQIFNRTKEVTILSFNKNSGKVLLKYKNNCPHNEQVTRQNLGVYTAILKSSGLQDVKCVVESDDFSEKNQTIMIFSWRVQSLFKQFRWLMGKIISSIFCKTYLQSDDVIKNFHSNLIVSFEKEIAEKEAQRNKSERYFNQLIEQQNNKEQELTELVEEKTHSLELAIKEKDTLFENVSHELKTPLTLIMGRSEQLLKREDLNTATRNELKHIEVSTEQLYQLVNQLLQLAEVKHQKALKEPIDIIEQTQYVCDSLSSLAQNAGTSIKYILNSLLSHYWLEMQTGAWSSIITNLVTNAVKYGDNKQPITVLLTITDETTVLSVSNKGKKIDQAKLKHIFTRFEQLNINKQGQGLGLAIVKELTTNHLGDIGVSSTNNETVFTVTLPNLQNKRCQTNPLAITATKKPSTLKGKQSILIVEDNQELREFITSALSVQFTVITAEHGQAAIDWLANNILPDLILSDVMMPVMDGYQLCETLKQDPVYQYIPLFLLTAKADAQSMKKGLALAADDYIAKPFNTDVLITKIGNQLATHAALKKHLQSKLLASPDKTPTNKLQSDSDTLLEKVREKLAEHYQNADIKAVSIAQHLHSTEKTLNRKLQVIIGKSISELLREYRLNQAKQLLAQGHKPKNVYFNCGFNSMSYFSQSYKKEFGYSPSDFKKQVVIG